MQVMVLSEKVIRVQSELLILGFFQDVRPLGGYAGEIDWFTDGSISFLIRQKKIRGALGESALLATRKVATPQILLIGLGSRKRYSHKVQRRVASQTLDILARLKVSQSVAELWGQEACAMDLMQSLESILSGWKERLDRSSLEVQHFQLRVLTQSSGRVRELDSWIHRNFRDWSGPSSTGVLVNSRRVLNAKRHT